MNATILRQLWSTVEETQTQTLNSLDDASLVNQLLGDLQEKRLLQRDDLEELGDYIRSHLTLIRELAEGRLRTMA
ncbi:hypothetical protein NEA10_12890 [Phormidium yuhuli AB48]|uniref:Uncharacterized protein n=1 Tax=Phormidium yuhuli AB48 TaxID=2940671 RepID=A0ABY5ALR2_9CYAN|nr:hypothetical protein [Phormidium yuhuli]USR89767.1 hypothetical protein NEA10_12890 [Phormidium yuhuli AB48]